MCGHSGYAANKLKKAVTCEKVAGLLTSGNMKVSDFTGSGEFNVSSFYLLPDNGLEVLIQSDLVRPQLMSAIDANLPNEDPKLISDLKMRIAQMEAQSDQAFTNEINALLAETQLQPDTEPVYMKLGDSTNSAQIATTRLRTDKVPALR